MVPLVPLSVITDWVCYSYKGHLRQKNVPLWCPNGAPLVFSAAEFALTKMVI